MTEKFPYFWNEIEDELCAESEDLCPVKSVFSALGYSTKTSIASIKTRKNIKNLESDFMKLRLSETKFRNLCQKYPAIEEIDSFTPGLIAVMFQIVSSLKKPNASANEAEIENIYRRKVLDSLKKVYRKSEPNIIVNQNELGQWQCQVLCPTCDFASVLSSYVNENTGRVTFNVNNFTRHLMVHGKSYDSDPDSRSRGSLSEADSLLSPSLSPISSKESNHCQKCEKNHSFVELKSMEFQKMIAAKDAENMKIRDELKTLQRMLSKKSNLFAINLCLYEPIKSPDISISENVVQFTDSTNTKRNLYFNQIYNVASFEEKFNGLIHNLDQFIDGESICVFSHGITGGGKSYTMFGTEADVGILFRTVSYILNKKQQICVTAVELFGKNVFDLIDNGEQAKDEFHTEIIATCDEFGSLISKVISLRKQKETNQNKTSSRSHLFIIFSLEGNAGKKLVFADLAGFENPKGKENSEETQFINSSLSSLNTVLLSISRKEVVNYRLSALTKLLEPYLKNAKGTIMLYHLPSHSVKKGLEYIKDLVVSSRSLNKRSASDTAAQNERRVLRIHNDQNSN